MLFNGATYDQKVNNAPITLLASAARTAETISPDQTNYNARGVMLVFDVTAVPGGEETVIFKLYSKDALCGKYNILFSGLPIWTTGNRVYFFYPSVMSGLGAGYAPAAYMARSDCTLSVRLIHLFCSWLLFTIREAHMTVQSITATKTATERRVTHFVGGKPHMTVQSITTTVTATERRVRVALAGGTTRYYAFGLVQDKDQKWVLPDTAVVAREVNALIEAEAVAAQETPDNAVAAELAAIAPETASITNVAQVGQPKELLP
jgi:hypothetical protein